MQDNYKLSWIFLIVLFQLISHSAAAREFRVAIKTNNFTQLTHDKLVIGSDDGQIILVDNEQNVNTHLTVSITPAETYFVVTNDQQQINMNSPIYIYPEHNGRLIIESIIRGDAWSFNPSYRGFLEIHLVNGKIQVINTVTVEQYLYGVVPSEMVDSWPLAALKAQAVASRTYVIGSIIQAEQAGQLYHVDDSVFAQVYNNRQESSRAKEAVDSTNGLVMLDDQGHLIRAYFHSTSCGVTAAAHEVWGGSTISSFPGVPVSYLLARPVTTKSVNVDFTDENKVLAFLKDKTLESYEQDSPWFRWRIEYTRLELEQIINANLVSRYQMQPQFVLTKDQGEFVSKPITNTGIGELQDISVVDRGTGGNIMTLRIQGSGGTYQVSKELNIRYLLCPTKKFTGGEDIIIERMCDHIANYPILPSACIAFDVIRNENDTIESVVIYGGGNGHGVGLSQWGAKGMAEDGYNYTEILHTFYQGVKLFNAYDIANWYSLIENDEVN